MASSKIADLSSLTDSLMGLPVRFSGVHWMPFIYTTVHTIWSRDVRKDMSATKTREFL